MRTLGTPGRRRIGGRTALLGVVAAACVLVAPAPASALSATMGEKCRQYIIPNVGVVGYRCAKGTAIYSAYDSSRWSITYYRMYYRVSAGLSWGPHMNETGAGPSRGWAGYGIGPGGYNSPDSGGANVWIDRTGYGTSRTYRGQTVFSLTAWSDIPNVSDPSFALATATF